MKHSKTTGFTLIELMIVVAIIAILASIAIPSYNGYISGARMTEAKNNIAALKLAEEEFFLENNSYFEDTSNDNTNLASKSGGLWTASAGDNGVNFTYTVSVAGNKYSIKAVGNSNTPSITGKEETYSN